MEHLINKEGVNRSAEKEAGELLRLIGNPPEGSHPDDWYPRGETWHLERQNWIAEVERQRAFIQEQREKIILLMLLMPESDPDSSGEGSDGGAEFGEPRDERANTVPGQTELPEEEEDYGDQCQRLSATLRVWQDTIRDYVIKQSGAPEHKIDGAGCESGDPLDLTLAEIGQGINYVVDQRDELHDALKTLREAISDFNGHGMPGFRDRAVAYLALSKADVAIASSQFAFERHLSSHAPESSRDSSSPKTAGVLDKGGTA